MLSDCVITALRRRRTVRVLRPFRSLSHTPFSSAPETGTDRSPEGSGPPPIRVALTASAGRAVFATRRIAAGELIHTAKPLVAHPSPSLSQNVCYHCLRKLGSSLSFCSESCREQSKGFYEIERKADWSPYDDYCRDQGLKYPFMAKRLACMVISGSASADSLDILQPSPMLPQTILEMEEQFDLLKSTFIKAQVEDKLITFLTKEWYMSVLARIRINAFRIELIGGAYEDLLASAAAAVACEAAVGNAVYMLPSFYNHDCDPNTHIIWIDNVDARLKALRDIEAGEELRICYIDASMDREARQALLARGFGFQCRCLRCLSGD